VARGAVFRALDKRHGPKRITQCSYGFLRTEPFMEWEKEHKGVKPSIDKLDGEKYVTSTIDWLVKKGDELDYHAEYPISVYHLFHAKQKTFRCQEVLYVSDERMESHYKRNHEKNNGKKFNHQYVLNIAGLQYY
jgi:hypothetical protein